MSRAGSPCAGSLNLHLMDREGAKGINAALAFQIMAQAGFPCASALNLCILALKPRGKIFAQQKDFRETLILYI